MFQWQEPGLNLSLVLKISTTHFHIVLLKKFSEFDNLETVYLRAFHEIIRMLPPEKNNMLKTYRIKLGLKLVNYN